VNQRPVVLLVKGDGNVTSCVVWINWRGKTRVYHNHNCQLLPGMSPHKTQTAAATWRKQLLLRSIKTVSSIVAKYSLIYRKTNTTAQHCYWNYKENLTNFQAVGNWALFRISMATNQSNYTNNQQEALYKLIYYSKSALHVSGDGFAHHQEHLTVFTVSVSVHPSCCRWKTTRSRWILIPYIWFYDLHCIASSNGKYLVTWRWPKSEAETGRQLE
jgi:hypothetical protein